MTQYILTALFILSGFLVVWHHAGWPLMLRRIAKPMAEPIPVDEEELPFITLVMPAHNEQEHIVDKLHNIGEIDYPTSKLKIIVACDGCSDKTFANASEIGKNFKFEISVRDFQPNRGKLATINDVISSVQSGIVALTDVSAMLPKDALLKISAHYADKTVGAVGGTYKLTKPGSDGEDAYWKYQILNKRGEAYLGAPLGMHGAFWTFRREAWKAIPEDTINDDFIMPLEIFGRGWKLKYDETIVVTEAEASSDEQDKRRRKRIAAGNAQQLVRLLWLLNPKYKGVALAFASGKALRVLMPFLMAFCYIDNIMIASGSLFFTLTLIAQFLAVILWIAGNRMGKRAPKLVGIISYIFNGHLASAKGVVRYALGLERKPWKRASI